MINTNKDRHTFCFHLGLEPVHRVLWSEAASQRRQSLCRHGLPSAQAYECRQSENSASRLEISLVCHRVSDALVDQSGEEGGVDDKLTPFRIVGGGRFRRNGFGQR